MNTLVLDWPAAAAAGAAVAGGKGWQLGRMAMLGVPVPDGFVLVADASRGRSRGDGVPDAVLAAITEALTARGRQNAPLAVRSSAPQEAPPPPRRRLCPLLARAPAPCRPLCRARPASAWRRRARVARRGARIAAPPQRAPLLRTAHAWRAQPR
jgi:hypothetical protein